jgi:hypothetical protein
MEEYLVEASKLLDMARGLTVEEKRVFMYFVENISVGEIRAVKELKQLGVNNPQMVIRKLTNMGLLEEGDECYNLAKPLREYLARRGKASIMKELSS